jgi:hypothetical protein
MLQGSNGDEAAVALSQNTSSVYNSISNEFKHPSSHHGGQKLTCGNFNPCENMKSEKLRIAACEGTAPHAMNLAQPGQSNMNNTFNQMAITGDGS